MFTYLFSRGPRPADLLSYWQTELRLVPPGALQWGAHGTDLSFTFNDTRWPGARAPSLPAPVPSVFCARRRASV